MPIRVGWGHATETRLFVQMIGVWTWEEYQSAVREIQRALDEKEEKIAVIYNFADSRRIPDHPLQHLSKLVRNWNPDKAVVLVIGVPLLMRTVIDILSRLYPQKMKHIHLLETMDEAEALLTELGY